MIVFVVSNAGILNELKDKVGQDVILFGLDSMSYYGLLNDISSDNIATLLPASLSSSGLVEIQNPAEVAAVLNTISIELCNIIAFGSEITADPFVMPDDDAEDSPHETAAASLPLPCYSSGFECNKEALLDKLIASQQLVAISTLGGFIFAGRIKALKNLLLKLIPAYIFAPGGDGSTLFSIGKVVINLEAATAVGS